MLADITDDEDANLLLDGELVEVTDGAVLELLDNELVGSLLDITLVDTTDDEDGNLLLEIELVNISDEAEVCSIAVLGIVELSLLFMTVLVEVIIFTEVGSPFDAAVVEVTDVVDVTDCAVEEFLLLEMIIDTVETISITKELEITLVDGAEVEITYSVVFLLLNNALIDILDAGVMRDE